MMAIKGAQEPLHKPYIICGDPEITSGRRALSRIEASLLPVSATEVTSQQAGDAARPRRQATDCVLQRRR